MEQFLNDITVWASATDWLGIVTTIAVILIPTVLLIWLTLFASEKAIASARGLYQQLRPQFDQATDPLVLAIAARTGLTADEVVKWLTSPDGILLTAHEGLTPGNAAPAAKRVVAVKAVRGDTAVREINIGDTTPRA